MLAPRMAPRYVEPSAKVSSRTPGEISRPGRVSAGLGGAAGAETCAAPGVGAGVFAAGAGADAEGGADGWAAAITAGFAAGCASAAAAGACGEEVSSGCGLRTTCAGSADAMRAGRTRASSLFFARDAKLPLGYLSR